MKTQEEESKEDGDYTASVVATDEYANSSEKSISVAVDTTAPVISGVNDETVSVEPTVESLHYTAEDSRKCSIELKGVTYEFTHSIITLYAQYISVGWGEIEMLELMSGTITGWKASSRYKESFVVTVKQLEAAKGLYEILFNRLLEYLNNSAKKLDSF